MSDNDLDEDPAEYHPRVIDHDGGNGAFCFFNADRECGPDCMAYSRLQPSPSPTLTTQQNECVLLVGVERLGRYVGAAASALKKSVEQARTAREDTQRREQSPPPNPMGG